MRVVRNKIYEFEAHDLDGNRVNFHKYKGKKKILFVNLPSYCEYSPQYQELNDLYREYGDQLEIIGLPPYKRKGLVDDRPVMDACRKKYKIKYPILTLDEHATELHPVQHWLIDQSKDESKDQSVDNFQKFLVDKMGKVVAVFASGVKPMSEEIREAVSKDSYQQSHNLQG